MPLSRLMRLVLALGMVAGLLATAAPTPTRAMNAGDPQIEFRTWDTISLDDGTFVESTISVAGVSAPVGSVEITLYGVTHDQLEGLALRLFSPLVHTDNIYAYVTYANDGAPVSATDADITFADDGDPSLVGTTGRYQPVWDFEWEFVTQLNPRDAWNGEWVLEIHDQSTDGKSAVIAEGWSIHFLPPAPAGDSTPPSVEPILLGTLTESGWYRSDVQLTWSVVDDESAVTDAAGCDPVTIAEDGYYDIACTVTSAGGTTTEHAIFARDTTPPALEYRSNPVIAPDPSGAQTGYSLWTLFDTLSGVDLMSLSCDYPDLALYPVGTTTVACEGYDHAGNKAVTTVDVIVLPPAPFDTTGPVITPEITGTRHASGIYTSDVTLHWSIVDGESTPSVDSGCEDVTITADGTYDITCSASSTGGANTQSVLIVRDTVGPVLTLSSTPVDATEPGGAWSGWSIDEYLDVTTAVDEPSLNCTRMPWELYPVGTTTVTCTVADVAGNLTTTTVDVVVNPYVAPDSTGPSIIPTVTGTYDPVTGYYTSDVTVSWQVSDPESGVLWTSGCDPLTITTDGESRLVCSAASDGGTTTEWVTIWRDATAPTLTLMSGPAAATSPAGAWTGFWIYDRHDDGTGLASIDPSCDHPLLDNFPVGTTTVTCTLADRAGNVATATVDVVVTPFVDTTPPVVTPVLTGTLHAASGYYTSAVEVSWTIVDPESPTETIFGCATTTVSADGYYVFDCNARSDAGSSHDAVAFWIDRTAPSLQLMSSPVTATGPDGATTGFTMVELSDPFSGPDNASLTCDYPQNGSYPVGTTTVTCTVADVAGNVATATVDVVVNPLPADTTAPIITSVDVTLVGQSIGASTLRHDISWESSDIDIAQYQLQVSVDDGPWTYVRQFATNGTIYTHRVYLEPNHRYEYRVRARDAAGNLGSWVNATPFDLTVVDETDPGITFSLKSQWAKFDNSEFHGGSSKITRTNGASASWTFTGEYVAWIASTNLASGQAEVFIDGVSQGIVNLNQTPAKVRQIVWSTGGLADGQHTLKIVSKATGGKRVQIDAFMAIDED